MIITGIDIETTGLKWDDGHRIVEVAALLYDLETGLQRAKWVQRINPQRPIDPGAQAVHGITFEQLAGEPVFEAVAPKLAKVMTHSAVMVAHNGVDFDFPFIAHELSRVGVAIPDVQCLDTMQQGLWATPFGKKPNLGELCFACGVPYDPQQAHGAEYDVQVMMECFFKAFRKGYYTLPQLNPAT